jgi:hypothetical protein
LIKKTRSKFLTCCVFLFSYIYFSGTVWVPQRLSKKGVCVWQSFYIFEQINIEVMDSKFWVVVWMMLLFSGSAILSQEAFDGREY